MKHFLPVLALLWTMAAGAEVELAFVGDVMLADTPGRLIRAGRDPFKPFAEILARADFRIANLECTVARSGKALIKPFVFRAHPRVLPVLRRHFDAVTVANNHSGDFGPGAFAEMLGHLERVGMPYFGGGRDLASAHRPLIVERQGLRIALLGYNEFFPRSFEADIDRPGVAWSEDEQVEFDIAVARREYRADLVIPVMHWGWEFRRLASDRQRQLARRLIDAGADAVVGGHPHVTQDVETYRGKPIIYSLGNFVFDGFPEPEANVGWLLRLRVDRAGVSSWQTVSANIDRQGVPHPAAEAGQCWRRGEIEPVSCSLRAGP